MHSVLKSSVSPSVFSLLMFLIVLVKINNFHSLSFVSSFWRVFFVNVFVAPPFRESILVYSIEVSDSSSSGFEGEFSLLPL